MSLLLSFSLLTSCGYQWMGGDLSRPTISVPFVCGDDEGRLSSEIASAIAQSGYFDLVSSGGDYQLKVEIADCQTEKIGFRVDPQKVKGKVKKNLLATEGRRTLRVVVDLCKNGQSISQPFEIFGNGDYDYVDGDSAEDLTFTGPGGQTVTVLPFSLGQLEPVDSAEVAVQTPLYRRIAQKIVDTLGSTL